MTQQNLNRQERQPKESTDSTDSEQLVVAGPPTCAAHMTTAQLFEYLNADALRLPPPDPNVAEHLAAGCAACEWEKRLLRATNPWLAEKVDFGAIHIEEIPPPGSTRVNTRSDAEAQSTARPESKRACGLSESVERTASGTRNNRLRVAEKMADALATPAEPFRLDQLEHIDQEIRAAPADRREEAAQSVATRCDNRWDRIDPVLRAQVEDLAAQLMTALSADVPPAGPICEFERGSPLSTLVARALLTYLMTRIWFINPAGDRLWEVISDEERSTASTVPANRDKQDRVCIQFNFQALTISLRAWTTTAQRPQAPVGTRGSNE